MKIENTAVVTLDERDVRLGATNGGLRIELPPGTTAVIVKVEAQLSSSEN